MDWLQVAREYGPELTILIGVGWLIITGRLVPGLTHEDVKKQRDRALELVYEMAQGLKHATPPAQGPRK